MNDHLRELAAARGLGALPDDLLLVDAAPPRTDDRLARSGAPRGFAEALYARTRRGPEEASTRVVADALADRPRELDLFTRDTADARLPRAAVTDWSALVRAVSDVPALDVTIDPARHIQRLEGFDLDAAWQLARLDAGRDVLGGVASQALELAATVERAHCPRWALAQLALLHHLGQPEAAPRMLEILLDAHAFAAAIDLAAGLGEPALEAYVAARTPVGTLDAAGRHGWRERLADSQRLATTDIAALSRAELAQLVGLAEVGLAQGTIVLDAPRFQAIFARYPTWRHAHRLFTTLVCIADADAAPTVVERYLSQFGSDALLAVMLRAHVPTDHRGPLAAILVREVLAYPDWVEPWRALARFAVTDPNTAMRLVKALG